MGTCLVIKGADFSKVAVSKKIDMSLSEKMIRLSRDNYTFSVNQYLPNPSRVLIDLGLKESLLSGYSKIKLSISPPWKLARQYWTGLASSQEDYMKTSEGGLRELISNSDQWSEVVEEDIPKYALGFSVLLNSDDVSAEQKDKYLSGFAIELIP